MSGLRCEGISASYNGTVVLDGVDLTVAPGEWVAVIGPNGAGKTTLLRVVAGMSATRGRVTVDDEETAGMPRRESARLVAVVPQAPVIPEAMPVAEYVLLGRTPFISYWGSESAHDVAMVLEIMEQVDLAPLAERPMGALSGGERQRAVLARALAQDARVLLLDEPTAALDLGHQQKVLDHVDALRHDRGIAVLSALHDLTLAAQYPDRLVLIDRGRVVAAGTPEEVLTSERLSHFYDATVSVLRDASGAIVVAPRRHRISDQ